jgi:hypothetical protein
MAVATIKVSVLSVWPRKLDGAEFPSTKPVRPFWHSDFVLVTSTMHNTMISAVPISLDRRLANITDASDGGGRDGRSSNPDCVPVLSDRLYWWLTVGGFGGRLLGLRRLGMRWQGRRKEEKAR